MKPLAYLPHDNSDLPREIIATLDELVDGRELSVDTAIGRVAGTKRWVVLFDDGDGIIVFGKVGKAPTLADVMRAARKASAKEATQ
jgi:hypothetical protein